MCVQCWCRLCSQFAGRAALLVCCVAALLSLAWNDLLMSEGRGEGVCVACPCVSSCRLGVKVEKDAAAADGVGVSSTGVKGWCVRVAADVNGGVDCADVAAKVGAGCLIAAALCGVRGGGEPRWHLQS